MNKDYLNALRCLADAGKHKALIPLLDEALQDDPLNIDTLLLLGRALRATNDLEKSISAYQIVCMLKDLPYKELIFLSEIYLELSEDRQSEEAARAAIDLSPNQHQAYVTLAMALQAQCHFSEALKWATIAKEIAPESADCHYAIASTYWQMGSNDAATVHFNSALTFDPKHSLSTLGRAGCLLSIKQWEQGFRDYEQRWQSPDAGPYRHKEFPVWDGRPFEDFLLVWKEQGIGDDIFFLGFLPQLLKLHHHVVVEIDPRLLTICTRSFPSVFFLGLGDSLGDFPISHAIPLGSLPKLLYSRGIIRQFTTPYLRAFPKISDGKVSPRIANKIRVGLSWKTSRKKLAASKSASLNDFMSLALIKDLLLVNLQYGDCRPEIAEFNKVSSVPIEDAGMDIFQNIENLAALVASCDIVITISNVTAHLACALNKPTWILLPKGRGLLWFWHLGENPSPWYPTATLIRQAEHGKWEQEITTAVESIKNFVQQQYT